MKNFHHWFSFKKTIKQEENSISSLAPKVLCKPEDIDKIRPYLNKLRETIDARGINNIALTGSYGSGKSTILKTFKSLFPKYDYLNISLAAFNKKEENLIPTPTEKEDLERLLEISILQQIFYHVKPSKIPESRFKRIISFEWWEYLIISFCFIIWIISTILLLKYDYLNKINPNEWKATLKFDWVAAFIICISFTGLGLFSKLLIQLFSNSKINKVNIKGELELGDKINNSVFNEHLEEILYFFERTPYNVVIIEDLDRFDNTDIFTKLREINILLNNSKLINKNNREINFVYAIGDDLFKDKKERVKFFEYIIPIIPFINSSNAAVQLQTLIKESGLEENIFKREFVSDVITFIDDIDMRLLINIFHEFVIYRQTLNPNLIKKPEELFSIITYKNLEPSDFANLNKREGKLYKLLNDKKIYIEKFVNKINQDIENKQTQIEEIENEIIIDIRELRAVYISQILSILPEDTISDSNLGELLEDDNFEKLKNGDISCTSFSHYSYRQYNKISTTVNFKFSDIENQINPHKNYDKRLQLVKDKSNKKTEDIQKAIQNLKIQKKEIELWDLKQIFEEVDLDQYINKFSNNALLRSLILNGYINENYNDYISLFHEGSITRDDLTFERNVKGGYVTPFAYNLNKIEGLMGRIDLRYFSRESILNFDLLDFLGNNYEKHPKEYNAIIHLLCNERKNSIEFIDEYIMDEYRPIHIFIEKLTIKWNDFFYYLVNSSGYHHEKISGYLRLILCYVKAQTIISYQSKKTLYEFIAKSPDFLSLLIKKEDAMYRYKMKNIIKDLDIKFETLANPTAETKELFDYVYQNNHYLINKENIQQMLQHGCDNFDIDLFNTKNYTSIKESGCEPIIDYIDGNIDEYIQDIYLQIEDNIEEEESYLIDLLNNDDISLTNKNAILKRTTTTLADISEIDNEDLQVSILEINKVEPTWENIFIVYEYLEGLSKNIIDFINLPENTNALSKQDVPLDKDKDGKMLYFKMWKEILASAEITFEAFELILKSSNTRIKLFDFENTQEDRLKFMVQEKKFAFANSVYEKFSIESKLRTEYLEVYKLDLLKFEDFEIDEEHLSLILRSKIYSTIEINTILESHEIADWNSKEFLLSLQYRLYTEPNVNISNNKIKDAISALKFDIYNVGVINNYFEKFNKSEINTIINLLKDEEYIKYLSPNTQESIQIAHTSQNDTLFYLMKSHNYIGKSSRKTKKGYQIFKNRSTLVF